MLKRIFLASSLIAWALCLLECGTVETRSTTEQMTNARIAVETAEKVNAKTYDPENLRQAQDALAIARDAYANKEFERAFQFSKKATIYALVAKARTESKQTEEKLTNLKTELNKVRAQTESYMEPQELEAVGNTTNTTLPASAAPANNLVPTPQVPAATNVSSPSTDSTQPAEVKP